ncbi:MAG: orotate phosphoribosyltransferase [Deltaproteobacteria bacterium]|nr:orotate phosphoribosyltransferase [Deltaproteobacteria bacterium]
MSAGDDVLDLLAANDAVLTGTHVVFTSGRHGSAYVNKDAIYPHTAAVARLCAAFADRFRDAGVEVVCGPVLGGVVLAQWTAHHLAAAAGPGAAEVLAVYAERADDRKFVLRRGYDRIAAGRRVLVVEDVLTTGGSLRDAVAAVRAAGGEVVGAAALVNRGGVTAEQVGAPVLHSLATIDLDSWDEAACPLCRDGVPVETRVGKGAEFLRRRAVGDA